MPQLFVCPWHFNTEKATSVMQIESWQIGMELRDCTKSNVAILSEHFISASFWPRLTHEIAR
jgi:hypothetical protein